MLNSTENQGGQSNDQDELRPSQLPLHEENYPFIEEFSEFIASVSMDSLKYKLMTHPQRIMANALWEAQNYGGSKEKCIKHLKEIYGPKWYEMTTLAQHMDDPRPYYEFVLLIEHRRQWDERKKLAKLREIKSS